MDFRHPQHLLSGELATLLSGRYVEIKMQPLSFREYMSAMPNQTEVSRKYVGYLIDSSFLGALELRDQNKIREYLSGIYHTIFLKDVVARLKINDVLMLENLVLFMFDNIGNIASTKRIADTMTSDGRAISVHTVETTSMGFMVVPGSAKRRAAPSFLNLMADRMIFSILVIFV